MSFPRAIATAGAASAALWLGMGLLLYTGTGAALGLGADNAISPRECRFPREVASVDGWTTEVRCAAESSPSRSLRGPARLLFGLTLDLNRADAKALEVLPRIGPSRAAAIVRAREEAEFASVAELARVSGIGPKTIAALSGWVDVGGAP